MLSLPENLVPQARKNLRNTSKTGGAAAEILLLLWHGAGGSHEQNDENRDANEEANHPERAGAGTQIQSPAHPGDLLGHPGAGVLLAEIESDGPIVRVLPFRLVDLLLIHGPLLIERRFFRHRPISAMTLGGGRFAGRHWPHSLRRGR